MKMKNDRSPLPHEEAVISRLIRSFRVNVISGHYHFIIPKSGHEGHGHEGHGHEGHGHESH